MSKSDNYSWVSQSFFQVIRYLMKKAVASGHDSDNFVCAFS